MTNETTPDAVERAKLLRSALCAAASDADEIRATLLAERARHAEEVARLEERLAVQERATNHCGTVLGEQKRRISDLESENDDLRSSVRSANVTALSALSGAGISTPEEGFPAAGWGELGNCIVRLAKDRDSLRDQLREVEGEREEALRMVDGIRKSEKTARESMVINMRLRDEAQAENVRLKAERDALRSLLPDVRACAEYCRNILIGPPGLAPVALAARRILAALDSQGGEGE